MLALSYLAVGNLGHAHSASDAYLTLTAAGTGTPGQIVIHGQWDIALRDLDFVLPMDDDADGRLTWGEVRRHQAAIERFAYQHIALRGGSGNPCAIKRGQQLIDAHADGAYAVLFFDAVCAPAPHKVILSYSLFFTIDPSHRAIVVMHSDGDTATAVLSPENPEIPLPR
jgi:hypothetical protein